jgi:hypothetical protein
VCQVNGRGEGANGDEEKVKGTVKRDGGNESPVRSTTTRTFAVEKREMGGFQLG